MFNWFRNLKRGEKFDLSSVMSLVDPEATYSERVHWLEQLVDWLRGDHQTARVKFLIQFLQRNPEAKEKTGQLLASLVVDAKLTRLFSETGVSSWMSMTHEFMSRFIRVFLPAFSDDLLRSGKDSFAQVFYDDLDPEWISGLPTEVWKEFVELLRPFLNTWEIQNKIVLEMIEASLILGMKCGSIMVREDFSMRAPDTAVLLSHPALTLQNELLKFRDLKPNAPMAGLTANLSVIEICLEQMDLVSTAVKEHLERYGVSIDLVFQRERLKQYLWRIRYLVKAVEQVLEGDSSAPSKSSEPSAFHRLFLELVYGSAMDQDFSHLMRKNLSLASKKIVDFTGSTGDHYIARTPVEMKRLFWGAVGGGVITAFAVLTKYGVDRSNWPLFLDFFYAGLVYSCAFLIIHFCHCTLATKQPSMTAASLANKIHTRSASGKDDEAFAFEIKRLIRSQSASIFGNIVAVIPVAVCLDQLWNLISGHHFFNLHESEHLIQSVSPWRSGAWIYACMTGGLLWLGGIFSGWVENAMVYHRIPNLIKNHKVLRRFLGVHWTTALSDYLSKNVAGISGSIGLGFFLAGWPVIGRFLGLPLDIRHVTFSTGAAAAAISAVGPSSLGALDWFEVVIGMLGIGFFNFLISFLLALTVAIRAKEIPVKRALVVFRLVLQR